MVEKATRDAYGEALVNIGEKYKNIVVVDCDLGSATRAKKFGELFPDRFFQIGIQEQNGVSFAAGLAIEGMRPFISSFGAFLTQQAKAQIMNSVAYSNAPVVLVGSHSGLAIGKDGATQMGIDDLNSMYGIPSLEIYSPADEIETKKIVEHLAQTKKPAYLRISRRPQKGVHDNNYNFEFNKGEVLKQGRDLSFYATGDMVLYALQSAKKLSLDGINTSVVNFATLKPLDQETILKISRESKGIITLEDHLADQGFGLRVKGIIAEYGIGIPVKSVGIHGFGESGDPEDLYRKHGMDQNSIVSTAKEFYRIL
jgi:transketolase